MKRKYHVMSVEPITTTTNLRVATTVRKVLFVLAVTFVSAVGGLTNEGNMS